MSIELKYKDLNLQIDTILWDWDSYFIDFKCYWSRLIGSIAQKVAENTTDNWNKFTLVRTQAIKTLGVNIESNTPEPSSPASILPLNIFAQLLVSSLKGLLQEKNREDLNYLFQNVIDKALSENQVYINDSLIQENLDIIRQINKKVKQVLITNDSKENNNLFIKEAKLENYVHQAITQANKEQLSDYLRDNSILITKNIYLQNFYKKRKIENVLVVEDISLLGFNELIQKEPIVINIDGASRGNPGPSAIGVAIYKDKDLVEEISEFIGDQTNNFAEYTALIRALEISLERGYRNIEIRSDSELVVNQINKVYKVRDAYIKELFDKACFFIEKLSSFKISYTPREENLRADKLANNALNSLQQHKH